VFFHAGALYLLGTTTEYGFTVIRRSMDGGKSWTTPTDAANGLLHGDGGYHCAPGPILRHRGRLWRAMEDAQGPGGWGVRFRSFMMSIPEDADPLQAENWINSNRLGRNPEWLEGRFGGWLEGNAVATPEGRVVNLLRVDFRENEEKAAWVEVSEDGRHVSFDPENDFFVFPGGCKKFTIRYDPTSNRYWSLANYVPPAYRQGKPERTRNTLALISSADLRHWDVRQIVLHHPDAQHHGFQYSDWLFEGDDLIAVVRTAHDDGLGGAHNQHDANFLTFHRIPRFRESGVEEQEG
jgi:hypothetical protein